MSTVPSPGSCTGAHAVRVWSAPKDGTDLVRFAGAYRGMMTHWDKSGRRTRHCFGSSPGCPQDRHKLPSVWKGYAPGEVYDPAIRVWVPVVIEVTESLEELLHGRELRGEVWAVTRELREGKRTTVTGTYIDRMSAARPCFDVKAVLCRFYHEVELLLDVPNPVPRRMMMDATDSVLPALVAESFSSPAPTETVADAAKVRDMLAEMRKAWGINGRK